jgi:uncharacterized protein (DUF486 family)
MGPNNFLVIILLILVGSVCYALAQYSHLLLGDWTILKGLAVSIPFVLVEYLCILNANHMAHENGIHIMQIFLMIMCLNFVAIFAFSRFAMGEDISGKDGIAFALIASAFALSYNPGSGGGPGHSGDNVRDVALE